ncbi:MAG: DNA primase noncatalytic subunit PriX, partial [Thermofilaceae archaeon]
MIRGKSGKSDASMNRFDPVFVDYLKKWFRGPLGLSMVLREIGVSGMDNEGFARELSTDAAVDLVLGDRLGSWRTLNWYMSNAYAPAGDYSAEGVLYDRLAYDFDSEEAPWEAVAAALRFAQRLEESLATRPLVVETGFKGAYVYVFLSEPQPWSVAEKLWRLLALHAPRQARKMIDASMNQWNRVCRIPLTYNLKKGERRLARIIYPEEVDEQSEFAWSMVKLLDISRIEMLRPRLPPLPEVKRLKPKPRGTEKKWVWNVVEKGLQDGRKRFMFHVLIPYLVSIGKDDGEILDICRTFIENSCRNHGKCDKVYESWIRSVIRSARNHGFK